MGEYERKRLFLKVGIQGKHPKQLTVYRHLPQLIRFAALLLLKYVYSDLQLFECLYVLNVSIQNEYLHLHL